MVLHTNKRESPNNRLKLTFSYYFMSLCHILYEMTCIYLLEDCVTIIFLSFSSSNK